VPKGSFPILKKTILAITLLQTPPTPLNSNNAWMRRLVYFIEVAKLIGKKKDVLRL
jgi:hypothetical protein